MTCSVLIVEDEAIFAKNVKTYLTREGFDVRIAGNADDALAEFDEFRPAMVLLDYNLPGANGLDILSKLRAKDSNVPVVMLTGRGGVEVAVQAMKSGAADYLSKPVVLAEIMLVINRVTQREQTTQSLDYYQQREAKSGGIESMIGNSQPMRELKAKVEQIIIAERSLTDNDAPAVLVMGETGTGKELVSRALHYSGVRSAKPFIEINCASIPSSLLEAELFGYERGAFTDAKERKRGLVEAAEGGTLFLDEIGEIDLTVQAKLLKLLEEKKLRRLGGIREQKVNVRIIAATNRDLELMVREGKFRSDLFYRLCIVRVVVPPLRERNDDILAIAQHFLATQTKRYGRSAMRFSSNAEQLLRSHHWPGNVRELRNAIEQAVLLSHDTEVSASQFPFFNTVGPDTSPEAKAGTIANTLYSRTEEERDFVLKSLTHTGWNVTRAAKMLGLSRDTLRYRIEKFGLKPRV